LGLKSSVGKTKEKGLKSSGRVSGGHCRSEKEENIIWEQGKKIRAGKREKSRDRQGTTSKGKKKKKHITGIPFTGPKRKDWGISKTVRKNSWMKRGRILNQRPSD